MFSEAGDRPFTNKFRVIRVGRFNSEIAGGEAGIFKELQSFVVGVGFCRIEKQHAKRVARGTVIAQKTFQTRFLHARLLVNGSDVPDGEARCFAHACVISLRPARNRIDERGSGWAKIKKRDGGAVRRF